MTPSPRTGPELADALGAALASGITQLNALADDAFFAPQGEAWSPAVHVRHLSKSARPLTAAMRLPRWLLRLRFGRPRAPSRSFDAMRSLYQSRLTAGAQAGRFTPRPEPPPTDPVARRRDIIQAWTRATIDLQQAIAGWPEEALDRHLLPHPLLGPLTVREMLCFTVYHTSHHLRRIAERQAVTA